MRSKILVALLLLFASVGCRSELERSRAERDEHFRDPVESPLATSAIRLLDQPEIVFGSAADSGLVWHGSGISPQHARFLVDGSAVFIEPMEGSLEIYPDRVPISGRTEWSVGQRIVAGPVLLILQKHPVGPVVRVIDPQAPALSTFAGLKYFAEDPSFRVRGKVTPHEEPVKITILDTQGWERPAWIYGKVHFSVSDVPQELDLILFQENPRDNDQFMLLLQDATTGKETYPAGRYLYVDFAESGEVWIDFNELFNPYCAYGNGFACPLPPPGNRLSVAIRAGEMTYPRHVPGSEGH